MAFRSRPAAGRTTRIASTYSANRSAWKVAPAARGVGAPPRPIIVFVFAFTESRDQSAPTVTLEICARRVAGVLQGAERVQLAIRLRCGDSATDLAPLRPRTVALTPRALCRHPL